MNSETVFSLRSEELEHSSNKTTSTSTSVSMLKLLATWRWAAKGPPRKSVSSSDILVSMGETAAEVAAAAASTPLVPMPAGAVLVTARLRPSSRHFQSIILIILICCV